MKDEPKPDEEGTIADPESPAEVRRRFGNFILERRTRRRNPKLSQGEAAQMAGISRETWNRIERGKQLPDPDNIQAIAETLNTDVIRLFRRAGYKVPTDLQIESRRVLTEKLLACWDESTSTVGFTLGMIEIWQNEQQPDVSPRYIVLDQPFVQILVAIQENLTRTQQLRLANELIQNIPVAILRKERLDSGKIFDEIDRQLSTQDQRTLLRPTEGTPKLPIALYEIRAPDGTLEYHLICTDVSLLNYVIEQVNSYHPKSESDTGSGD